MRLGEDPWSGAGENFRLSSRLVQPLRSQRIFTLAYVRSDHAPRGRRSRKSALDLGINGAHAAEWNIFLNILVSNYIHLISEPDRLIWTKNTKTRQYTVKHGYAVAIKE